MFNFEEALKILLSVALSVFIVLLGFRFGVVATKSEVYTVDVMRILNAHNALVGKAAKSDLDSAMKLTGVSERVSEAIRVVSAGETVLISAVVASKLENDITDAVLDYLGLPKEGTENVLYLNPEDLPAPVKPEDFDPKDLIEFYEKNKQKQEQKRLEDEKMAELKEFIP